MSSEAVHETRLERILGIPLADDAVRQWPQSGELLRGSDMTICLHTNGIKLVG